MSAMREQRRTK